MICHIGEGNMFRSKLVATTGQPRGNLRATSGQPRGNHGGQPRGVSFGGKPRGTTSGSGATKKIYLFYNRPETNV